MTPSKNEKMFYEKAEAGRAAKESVRSGVVAVEKPALE